MGFEGATYYAEVDNFIRHPDEFQEQAPIVNFEEMSLSKFNDLVRNSSLSNADRVNDTIAKVDSWCFQVAHPEYLRTANNERLINHWLTTHNISNPTFPDYVAAFEDYKDSGLLDMDAAELARDNNQPRIFTGIVTKQKFSSVDDMIAAERHAALTKNTPISDEQAAFEQLPPDEALAFLRKAERLNRQQVNASEIQDEADAWIMLHPEYRDDTRNGKLLAHQLKINGATKATIADYERASQQLRESGLLSLNKRQLDKQHAEQLKQRAVEASKAFNDQTTEQEMYELPLDELRRRSSGNFSGSDF